MHINKNFSDNYFTGCNEDIFFFFLNGDLRTLSATDTCTSVVDH